MSQLRTNSIVPVGGIPAGASGGGVVQIVEGSTITQVESSFSSETNLGLSASITPRSSSNKILIMVNMTGCGSRDTATAWRNALKRDSTDLASFNNYTGSQQASGEETYPNGMYLDSPATTSSITYSVHGKRSFGSANCYFCHNDSTNPRQRATIVLMEISG